MSRKEKKVGNDTKKPLFKKWWFWAIIIVIIAAIFGNTGSTDENEEAMTETHIYDNAEIKDVMNGLRTEKLGEYSVIRISSEEATEEALTDWYFNYVVENDYNWCMILYTDRDDNMGVYAISGIVEKDVYFEQDEYEDYSLKDSPQSTIYTPTDEGTLEEIDFDES